MSKENRNRIILLIVFNFSFFVTIVINAFQKKELELNLIWGVTAILFYLVSSTVFFKKYQFGDKSKMLHGIIYSSIYPILVTSFLIIYFFIIKS
jgi:hypothetical protein